MPRYTNKDDERTGATGMGPLLRVTDAALILGLSPKTIHKLVREGKLSCVQVTSRERRFTDEQVQDYIRSQTIRVRVDMKAPRPVSSTPRKGGLKSSGDKVRAQLRKEMRSWR